jgi:hypothetical protein
MSKSELLIHLGPGWMAFAPQLADVLLLGVVQRGLQIGALAQRGDGSFVQINGDVVQSLNRSRVEHVLRTSADGIAVSLGAPATSAVPPAVTVRKRRRLAEQPLPSPPSPMSSASTGSALHASDKPRAGLLGLRLRTPARPVDAAN